MIVKNEAACIRDCLSSVAGVADEIIVVDTGSTDGTPELCRACGAVVHSEPWADSFAAARNKALAAASGRWVLWLDADEEVDARDRERLRAAAENGGADAFGLQVVNYYGACRAEARPDRAHLLAQIRLFRRDAGFYFVRDIHETLRRHAGAEVPGGAPEADYPLLPVRVHHFGYLDDAVADKDKFVRNMELLEKERQGPDHDPWCDYHIAGEYYRQGELERAFESVNVSIAGFLTRGELPPSLAYKLKYEIMFVHGSMRGAWPGIERALQLYPDYVDLHFYKGVLLLEHGLYVEAATVFERCLELGESGWRYLSLRGVGSFYAATHLGVCMEKLGKPAEAAVYTRYAAGLAASLREREALEAEGALPGSGELFDHDCGVCAAAGQGEQQAGSDKLQVAGHRYLKHDKTR